MKVNIKQIIREEIEKLINEDGEGGNVTGGANSTQGVNADGSADGSFGISYPAFGSDKEGKKRSKDFKNGSMCMQRLSENEDSPFERVNSKNNPSILRSRIYGTKISK